MKPETPIVAIIQARTGSTRLPGKVLLPLGGKTVLEQVVERSRRARALEHVVVATSSESSDDPIYELCSRRSLDCFRGSLTDVLDRYYWAAKASHAQHVCRLTADCPLMDPEIVDQVALEYDASGAAYASTGRPLSTFPDGMDTEIFSFQALEKAWCEAKHTSEREHVTPYIWKHPDMFRVHTVICRPDLSRYRLTLDEPCDYQLLQEVYRHVKDLTLKNIIAFLDAYPEINGVNSHVVRDAGYHNSVKADRI